jgi:phage terminase small subunit
VPIRKADKPDKTEPPPATPAKPAAEVAPPAPSLQTTAKVDELEQKIRALLTRATRDLDRIEVRTLSADRRTQYDEARRFAEQAEAALKVKNLAFAEQLADKAATLADLLAKR